MTARLVSLDEALDWARSHWANQRTAPVRLHTRDTEGIGPFFTAGMSAALDGSPEAFSSSPSTQRCDHPLLAPRMSPHDCPECSGSGLKEARIDRYLFPMSRALTRLHDSLGPGRQPHPYHLVIALASQNWNARAAAGSLDVHWDRASALFLLALRRLHSFYEEGPVNTRASAPSSGTVAWTDKSAAQQNAETAA